MLEGIQKSAPVLIVTGAAGQIGRHLVTAFRRSGHFVCAVDINPPINVADDKQIKWIQADLTHDHEIDDMLSQALGPHKRVSALINAIGLITNETVIQKNMKALDGDSLRLGLSVNLTAAVMTAAKTASKMIRSGGGCIVNFSSISAKGMPGQIAYSASKAGLEAATRCMADELGPLGVRVNAISLGFIDVRTTHEAVSPEKLEGYIQKTPLKRLGQLDEVLSAVRFLIDHEFVNGEILQINGGIRF